MKSIHRCAILLILLGFSLTATTGCGSSETSRCNDVVCLRGMSCDSQTGMCVCGESDTECEPDTTCNPQTSVCEAEDLCEDVSCERGMSCDEQTGECVCGESECAEGTTCNQEQNACEVAAEGLCATGSPWAPGQPAFEDASSAWKLDELQANGQRLSVTDIDGDGLADLSVRRAGGYADDFSDGGERASWLLRNTGDGTFEDVTKASGLVKSRTADANTGRPIDIIVWADVDNDGDLDAYTGFNKQTPGGRDEDSAEIMFNQGDATFEFGSYGNAARNAGEIDSPAGASFVDVDRDGHIDLWISQYAGGRAALQDRLLRGDGRGEFDEITDDVGLTTTAWRDIDELNQAQSHSLSWGSAACDLNGDGTAELLAASYGRAPNHLWLGALDGDGVSYTNQSVASAYAFDHRDDWSDNESARCYCKHNPEADECAGVPEPELIACPNDQNLRWNHANDREPFRLGGNTGTTVCADVDNDGWLDLLTTEIVHWDVGSSSDPSELLLNQQDDQVRFERPGNDQTGLTREHASATYDDGDITGAIFDFDNDGRKDVYIGSTDYGGTRGHLWHQQDDGTFEKVSLDDGIDHTSSHGVAVADYDRDGDLDLVAGHSRFRCSSGDHCYPPDQAHVRLFENVVGQDQNWLQIALEGKDGTNRSAIGARVTVETDNGTQVVEVGGGHGHYGIQHTLTQHVGLADACQATVTVRWPDQNLSEQTFVMHAGHRYTWVQGEVPVVVE